MGFLGDTFDFVTSPVKAAVNYVGSALNPEHGTGYQATQAPVQAPINQSQLSQNWADQTAAMTKQAEFIKALGMYGGANLQDVFGMQKGLLGQQQGLADQLQGQTMGRGPNPALDQLALTTGQNIANQASLMAGQRGASHNAGLLGRQIGMQGAQTQQASVGQAAVLRAQQQLAAQAALSQQLGVMGGQQAAMGNLAGNQIGNEQTALSNFANMANAKAGQGLVAQGGYNNALVGAYGATNPANSGVAQINAKAQQELLANLFKGLSSASGLGGQGVGGGGAGGALAGGGAESAMPLAMAAKGGIITQSGVVNGPQSPLAQHLSMSAGGKVKGKAQVMGDSSKNDTVKARLSPGEVVIPRTKVGDEKKMAAFLNGLLGTNLRAS